LSENGSTIGSNSTLSADQKKALGFYWKGKYQASLAAKKTADANLKNCAKQALAASVTVDDIKLLIRLDTPEGEAAVRAEINRQLEVAGWTDSEIGTQFSFEDIPDRRPLTEAAYAAGKTAGMEGKTCIAPHEGEAGQEWIRGWHDGQVALMSALDLTAAGMAQIAAEAEGEQGDGEGSGEPAPRRRGRPKGSKNGKAAGAEGATAH
jgi:hypothetical protein